jgi:ABC-type transport system involved in cytochrome c biogenesis permease subunit
MNGQILPNMTPEHVSLASQEEFFLIQISCALFLLAALIGLLFWFARKHWIGKVSLGVTILATLCFTGALVYRYFNVGHIPYVQLYETYLFVVWSIAVIALIADFSLHTRLPSTIAAILAAFTLIYIIQWPAMSREGVRLVPALQSPWLDVHIATAFLSYAGFAISAVSSAVYLVTRNEKVDELSYRLVAFAFPLLGLGILLGAVWANEAWGRYWGWDPKETAALVTWLVYAGYLHARFAFGWKGAKAGIFNLVGFACVLFTWLGLNLLSRWIETGSLHTYTT